MSYLGIGYTNKLKSPVSAAKCPCVLTEEMGA